MDPVAGIADNQVDVGHRAFLAERDHYALATGLRTNRPEPPKTVVMPSKSSGTGAWYYAGSNTEKFAGAGD